MGLTGVPFIVTLAVLAAAAFSVCVRLLPRFSGGGARPVLARAGLVIGTQLVAVFAVLAAVNSFFEFFGSWSDLLGTDGGGVNVVGGPRAAEPPAAAGGGRSLQPVSGTPAPGLPKKDGHVRAVVVHGARSGLTATSYVYTPPRNVLPGHRTLPVVLVLSARPSRLLTILHLPEIVAGQVAAGALPPAVYVLTAPPAPCVDVPGGRQGETFLSQDLPMAVAASYHVAADGWAVVGDASGGYCAAKLALAHSDRFTAAASAAASYGAPPGDLYGHSAAIRDENDLLWRLRHLPSPPVSLLVLAGRADARARLVPELVRPPGYAQVLTLTDGGALPAWRRDLPAVLRRLGRRLTLGS